MIKKKHRTYEHVLIVTCLIFFLTFLFRGADRPFIGNNAWNFNTYSLIAHNYVVYGFLETLFAPIVSVSSTIPNNPAYYLHHPQLLSTIQAVFFLLIGESFFTARLPVILITFLSAFLIYLIGKELLGKIYGVLCLMVSVLLPGFVVFGRMIGQEAFVLFFVLLFVWSTLKYLTKKSHYLLLIFLSVVLGTLSDWPMVYFTFAVALFLVYKKQRKLAVQVIGLSVLTAATFLVYSVWLSNGFEDLVTAFLVRGPGAIVKSPVWLITWPTTIMFRIIIYFSPIFVTLSFFAMLLLWKSKGVKYRSIFVLCAAFLIFGLCHILLYPEGSFGHAYWIYYLIPFIVFSSGFVLFYISSRVYLITFLFFLSFIYFLIIENWKFKEMTANMFRYYFAESVAANLKTSDQFYLNREGIFDLDMFQYHFFLNPKLFDSTVNTGSFVVYSCRIQCEKKHIDDLEKLSFVPMKKIYSSDAEVFIFQKHGDTHTYSETKLMYKKVNEKESLQKTVFSWLKQHLNFPQL